jgi:hypothetical protein
MVHKEQYWEAVAGILKSGGSEAAN